MTTTLEPPAKAAIARKIALKVRLHKTGVTSGGLYDLCGDLFADVPGLSRTEAVDIIQKQLAKLAQKGYVGFAERKGQGPRLYYPTDKLLAQYAPEPAATLPAEPGAGEAPAAPPCPAITEDLAPMTEPTEPMPAPTGPTQKPSDALRETLARALELLDGLHNDTYAPLPPNAEAILSHLIDVEDALRGLRPDLAASVAQARLYITGCLPAPQGDAP